jgi:hypothetical protein
MPNQQQSLTVAKNQGASKGGPSPHAAGSGSSTGDPGRQNGDSTVAQGGAASSVRDPKHDIVTGNESDPTPQGQP